MSSFIRNTVLFFEKIAGVRLLTATDSPSDVIVSGYSYPETENQQELSPKNCNRRQAGILYADIVDYSRLTEQDEEGTHHRLIETMKIMEVYVSTNNGRVAHFAGDAILAEFKDADNALNCAINMQLSDRRRNAGLSSDRRIQFRIGVNYGDVIADQGDIYGNAVNLAARLEALAHSGGICVSESVRRRLKMHPSFKFVAMGKQTVKNISDPVEAFRIEFGAERIESVDHSGVANVSRCASE
jgi:adenylate cyclase